jgi:hypothetical protein
MTKKATGPNVRPISEGYVRKGGQNPATSKVTERPIAPARIVTSSGGNSGPKPAKDR